jgi:hypothetical protein
LLLADPAAFTEQFVCLSTSTGSRHSSQSGDGSSRGSETPSRIPNGCWRPPASGRY